MGIRVKEYKKSSGNGNRSGHVLQHELKSVFQTRLDIKDWKNAEALYHSRDPKTWRLQQMISDAMKDALLTSQVENRIQQLFSLDIRLKKPDGTVDEEQTELLKKSPIYRSLTRASAESLYYESSVVELSMSQTIEGDKFLVSDLVPRTNIVPQTGLFYPDYGDETKKIAYRELAEYGVWILEFWTKQMPLLNKAIPHVLFKRFAQSCHSELCEINGIPPRVLKTNTQDKTMMQRAEKMMRDMGAASWFIIDEDESFEFANGVAATGEVYTNLVNLCDNNLCLLITGAILGQDTKNGSRSKDDVAKEMQWLLVQSDMAMVESDWNNISIPALKKHGILNGDLTFEFVPVVNIQELFDRTIKALEFYQVDKDWFAEQFGMKITGERVQPQPTSDKKKLAALLAGEDKSFFV